MIYDWSTFLNRLQSYPSHFHSLLPSCPMDQIEEVERKLGKLPTILSDILRHFNGAKLFGSGPAFVSFFRLSNNPSLPEFEWAPEWCIDTFTQDWRRAAGPNRENDWAIAMTNYGGLILLDRNENIKEWDTGESRWLSKNLPFGDWIETIMSEGEAVMAE